METTKFTGVFYRKTKSGDKVFYIKGKINGKSYLTKVGSDAEGVTAAYASRVRNEKHSISRFGEQSPLYKEKWLTLEEAFVNYYEEKLHDKSDGVNTKARFYNHIFPMLGNYYLDEITPEKLKSFMGKKLKEISFKTGRVLSPKTVNDLINIIRATYRFNKVEPNPAKDISLEVTNNERLRYLEEEEIKLLLKTIDEHPKMRKKELVKLFVVLSITTGARMSSVLNIKQSDLNGDLIRIVDLKKKNSIGKDFIYYVPVHDTLRKILPQGLKPNQYIVGGKETPMNRTSFNKMLQPILDDLFNSHLDKANTVDRVVIHTFRHTFGSLLAIAGTPIYTIKKLMNHSNIEMTMRYAKLAPDSGFEAVKNMKI